MENSVVEDIKVGAITAAAPIAPMLPKKFLLDTFFILINFGLPNWQLLILDLKITDMTLDEKEFHIRDFIYIYYLSELIPRILRNIRVCIPDLLWNRV